MIDDIAWHRVPALRASRNDKDDRDHAVTGVAIAYRPSGPALKYHALLDNPKLSSIFFTSLFRLSFGKVSRTTKRFDLR